MLLQWQGAAVLLGAPLPFFPPRFCLIRCHCSPAPPRPPVAELFAVLALRRGGLGLRSVLSGEENEPGIHFPRFRTPNRTNCRIGSMGKGGGSSKSENAERRKKKKKKALPVRSVCYALARLVFNSAPCVRSLRHLCASTAPRGAQLGQFGAFRDCFEIIDSYCITSLFTGSSLF